MDFTMYDTMEMNGYYNCTILAVDSSCAGFIGELADSKLPKPKVSENLMVFQGKCLTTKFAGAFITSRNCSLSD